MELRARRCVSTTRRCGCARRTRPTIGRARSRSTTRSSGSAAAPTAASICAAHGSPCACRRSSARFPRWCACSTRSWCSFAPGPAGSGWSRSTAATGGASLEYGLPTEAGLQCCYHGWHFAPDGTILDTPNDPQSSVRERLFHPAYPVHEYRGIVFAYMGPPEDVPEFPILDAYVQPGTEAVPVLALFPLQLGAAPRQHPGSDPFLLPAYPASAAPSSRCRGASCRSSPMSRRRSA